MWLEERVAEELRVLASASPVVGGTVALFKDQGVGVEECNDAGGIRKGQAM